MKRHGRFLSLLLAVMLAALMLVSASGLEIFIIASSDEYLSYGTSASYLETIGVMQGYGDGDLHLEEPIKRYQAALFFARLYTGITNDSAWGTGASAKFADVAEYGPVIDMVADMDIIRGYSNTKFGYNDGIRYQDMCAMLVRVLGYETSDMAAAYPMSYILKVKELGLDLANVKGADYLNRGQTAQMVYDALTTEIVDIDMDNYDKLQAIIDAVREDNGSAPAGDSTKETYLERNFNVSSTMYFEIVATENYSADVATYSTAEEGYIKAVALNPNADGVTVVGDTWTFAVEGTATADVSEADLIGKCLTVVFDDKTPTQAELDDEDCKIVHADIVKPVTYENLGELNFVKFDDAVTKLTLGTKTVTVADIEKYAYIWQYGDAATAVCNGMSVAGLRAAMNANTYFALDCYDYNNDGNYDMIVYRPYSFAQYAERTYGGTKYVMLGQYYSAGVYDTTSTTNQTADNFTHFVEYFLGKDTTVAGTASVSYTKYTPGNTTLKVSESKGELSANVTVVGDDIKHGDFMLYYYNPLVNKLEVIENLGTYQLGSISGYRPVAQTYTLDGAATSVGLPGQMSGNTGLLVGEGAYASTLTDAKVMVANYKKGTNNIKYIEYDGKIVYFEPYGDTDVLVGSDFVIVDINKTYDNRIKDNEDATEISFSDDYAIVSALDVKTGEYSDIKVESITYVSVDTTTTPATSTEKTEKFNNWKNKQALVWADWYVRDLFANNGVIYATLDEDNDGKHELYAYGTEEFNVIGAPVKTVGNGASTPSVYFTYNKSTEFVGTNAAGVSTDRVTTNKNTVSTVIAQDGYVMVKGELGNYSTDDNRLWLSSAAIVIESTDDQITIFDPTGYVGADVANNVYLNGANSVWSASTIDNSNNGISYYIMLENSSYKGSAALENADGSIAENENGQKLYTHEYKGLYNLVTGSSETITLVTTSPAAPATEIINSIEGVIYYDAENNNAGITTFGDVFVNNGKYHYGGFGRLAAKDKISFVTQEKDRNGDGRITGDENAISIAYDADSDKIYGSVSSLKVTFIDLDEGVDVDPDEFCYTDAYVFYQDNESNRKSYAEVTLEDREAGLGYPEGTFPIRRHTIDGKDIADVMGNGRVTALTAGKSGLIGSHGFFRWNGWSDYLIPAVDADGDTIWSYEGSTRIQITYYSYIYYDSKTDSVEAVVIRVGVNKGVIGANDTIPEAKDEPSDSYYNPIVTR